MTYVKKDVWKQSDNLDGVVRYHLAYNTVDLDMLSTCYSEILMGTHVMLYSGNILLGVLPADVFNMSEVLLNGETEWLYA